LKVELSCVGKGIPCCVGEEYVSIGDVVPGSLGATFGSKDAEVIEVVGGEALEAFNSTVWRPGLVSGSVEEVPRFEVEGHPTPATVASRLCSMGEKIPERKLVKTQKLRKQKSVTQC
jgi:hypothetical protein